MAVIAARTNYLIAIEPYWDATTSIEIPVYLSDAIFSPKQEGSLYKYHLDTEDGRMVLELPIAIFQKELLTDILNEIETLVRLTTNAGGSVISKASAIEKLKSKYEPELSSPDIEYVLSLFDSLRELEVKNWDGIWCRIIKNRFASAVLKDFDIIVGNPPWLKWSALPPSYRETIKEFCQKYGLFSSDKYYGGIESDVSTMVLYSAAEKWLKSGGRLAMLITRSVFKTESAEGFRRFNLPDDENVRFKVQEVHDFTSLRPFDDAVNKPTLLVLDKGDEPTHYPLSWVVWNKKGKERVCASDTLANIYDKTTRAELVAYPISGNGSPWLTLPEKDLQPCLTLTKSASSNKVYIARKGVCTDCNGVYYGEIKNKSNKKVVFSNNPSLGRNKKVQKLEMTIESDLVYPIARGKEISAFSWEHSGTYGVIPQESMHGYSEDIMLTQYPSTLDFFARNKTVLQMRSSLKRYLPNDPFYACWNVGAYTFAPYKVCWAEISGHFEVCILSELNGEIVVPDHKIYFIPINREDEALFLCAYLNSTIVEELVLAYVETTQIGTHITDYIHIPQYDPSNFVHRKLVEMAKDAQENSKNIDNARRAASMLIQTIL